MEEDFDKTKIDDNVREMLSALWADIKAGVSHDILERRYIGNEPKVFFKKEDSDKTSRFGPVGQDSIHRKILDGIEGVKDNPEDTPAAVYRYLALRVFGRDITWFLVELDSLPTEDKTAERLERLEAVTQQNLNNYQCIVKQAKTNIRNHINFSGEVSIEDEESGEKIDKYLSDMENAAGNFNGGCV